MNGRPAQACARWLAAILLIAAPYVWAAVPSCWPKQVAGNGSAAVVRSDATAVAVAWLCPDPYGAPRLTFFGGKWADFAPDWQALGADILAGGSTAMAKAWAQYVTVQWPVVDGAVQVPAEIYPLLVNAIAEARASSTLPTAVWKVAPNASYATRPAYLVTDGVRASVGTARATVGATCYCQTVRFVEGATTYCAVTPDGKWAAVCRKQ